ncbi:MAG: traC [Candidatus Midichloriaceae bacterium]|jgi:conjugal transfer ATP-binding protein TraC|nr:traC [Candidatus Midichloriaceae bacterium]
MKSIKDLKERFFKSDYTSYETQFPRLTNLLPYQVFDELDRLYVNDNSYGFMLEVTPLCGADEQLVSILSSMITDGVPKGCAIQVINWASPRIEGILESWKSARKNAAPVYQKLALKRVEYYADKNWDSLFENPFLIRNFRVFIAASIPFTAGDKGKALLIALKDQLKATLQNSGMKSYEVLPDEFLGLLDEWINPSVQAEDIHVNKWDKLNPIKESLSNQEQMVMVNGDGLVLEDVSNNNLEIRSFSVKNFPEVWAQWNNRDLIGDFYSDYLRIPCPFLTVFSFIYGNDEGESDKASIKSIRATQQASSGISRFMPSVHEFDRDWKFVNDKIKKGQKLVKAFYQVSIYARKAEVESCERYVRSLYKSKSWNLVREQYVQLQTWLAAMPFTLSEGLGEDLRKIGRLKTMVTWSCANLAPLQGEWMGVNTRRMMLVGRRGQIFCWDPFDNPSGNYNVAVIGKSGSGKSVFMQELVSSLTGAGGQVIVVDDGRSFMNSCLLQGGRFVEFSGESNLCINPFSIVSAESFEARPDYKEEVMHLLNLIIRQMCRQTMLTDDIENAFIQEAISNVWNEHKGSATVSHIAEHFLKHDDNRAKDLGLMMIQFTKEGLYSRFFEGQANIKLDDSFFVFEFDKIKSKPDLQRIALMVLIFLVSEKMFHGNRSRTISLVIDEAWSLLHGSHFAEFIEGIARRARKYNGNLITGTQSIDDYYKNTAATAAIQNTDWFCLLSQNKESIESMKKSGRISMGADMEKALSSLTMVNHQYSEVMIYGSSIGWAVGRLILDPYSVALYSSKGEDFKKIKDLQAQGLALEDALEKVASDISRGKK